MTAAILSMLSHAASATPAAAAAVDADTLTIAIIIGGTLIAMPILWLGIMRLSSLFGWSGLADKYRFDGEMPTGGQGFTNASMSLSTRFLPLNYNGCVTMVVAGDALYCRLWRLFSYAHPPLRLPWAVIETIDRQKSLFSTIRVVRVKGCATHLLLRGAMADAVEQAWRTHVGG